MTTATQVGTAVTYRLQKRLAHLAGIANRVGPHRPTLRHVHIRDGYAWATDSLILTRVRLPDGMPLPDGPTNVPAGALRAALRTCTKQADTTLDVTEEAAVIRSIRTDLGADLVQRFTIPHGDTEDYPTVGHLWPDDDTLKEAVTAARAGATCRIDLVDDIATLAHDLGQTGTPIRIIGPKDNAVEYPSKPNYVLDVHNRCIGLVMPIRVHNTPAPADD